MAALASVALAQDAIPTRVHRSSALPFLRPIPLGHTLDRDSREEIWTLGIANELRARATIYEDAETWRLGYWHRWSDKANGEWFFEVPLLWRGPGFMDSLIAGWHAFLADGNVLRRETPFGRSRVAFSSGDEFGSAVGVGDITLGWGTELGTGAGRIWTKLPTGSANKLLGSGAFDFALSYDQSWAISQTWSVSGQVGMVWQGKPRRLEGARQSLPVWHLGIHYRNNPSEVWTFQIDSEESPTDLGEPILAQAHRVVTFGYQKRLGTNTIGIYFSEDADFGWTNFPGGARIGPDFTLGFFWRTQK